MKKNFRDLTIGEAFDLLTEDEKESIYEQVGGSIKKNTPDHIIEKLLVKCILSQPTMLDLAKRDLYILGM